MKTKEHVPREHAGDRIHKRESWTRRGEASLDDEGAGVMARVSSAYLVEAICHYFFSRCLANVRGIRTASPSHRPRSVTAAIDRARPRSVLIWQSSVVPSDSSRLSRICGRTLRVRY